MPLMPSSRTNLLRVLSLIARRVADGNTSPSPPVRSRASPRTAMARLLSGTRMRLGGLGALCGDLPHGRIGIDLGPRRQSSLAGADAGQGDQFEARRGLPTSSPRLARRGWHPRPGRRGVRHDVLQPCRSDGSAARTASHGSSARRPSATAQRSTVRMRPRTFRAVSRLVAQNRADDGEDVGGIDLGDGLSADPRVHEPLQAGAPVLDTTGSFQFGECRAMAFSTASAKVIGAPARCSAAGIASGACEFAVLESGLARLGEAGVRISAQAEVAATTVDDAPPQPLSRAPTA